MQEEKQSRRHISSIGSTVRHLQVFDCRTSAYGIALTPTRIYVPDYDHHVINIIDRATNSRLAQWGTYDQTGLSTPDHPPLFCHPHGVALDDSRNRLYVAEWGNHRIVVLRLTDGSVEAVWGGIEAGPARNRFQYPCGLAVDTTTGAVYVGDSDNHCVKVLQPTDGHCVQVFGSGEGSGEDEMSHPQGVALDDECVYIADAGNHRVVVYNRHDGRFLRQIGQGEGTGEQQFQTTFGVSVDKDAGISYATDHDNHRVSVWRTCDGVYMRQWAVCTPKDPEVCPLHVLWDAATRELYVTLFDSDLVSVY
eukprot:TRINITY_DN6534_c0_g1_i1.p1 TRINITY_DN6534_c0_g1~~TRINITY_DN6534_c0_g1_i1.p1  ORF type:complete len:307 (-),score=16.35 TRINITY_DN6534_c0_g1_i1:58-978(-)